MSDFRGKTVQTEERFETKYMPVTESGCWLWTDRMDKYGYGLFYMNSRKYGSHRVSWEIHNGPIPEGKQINHKCHVRCCVNPHHLYVGTQAENMLDKMERGLAAVKLKASDILEIRNSTLPTKELAIKYDVSTGTIYKIISRAIWAHI